MIKFIVLLVIGYLGYRALKNWMLGGNSRSVLRSTEAVDDEMVKDPVCNIYVARQTGVRLVHEGREMIFCSEACRDRFLETEKKSSEST